MNPILEEMQKLGETVTEYQETNDKRLEAIEKGNDGLARELQAKLEKMDESWTASQARIKAMEADIEKKNARIEMLEALAERPKLSPEEKAVQDHRALFQKALRERFSDQNVNQQLKELERNPAVKAVTIGTSAAGGYAVPKEIGDLMDTLLLKLSDVVGEVRNIQVGTSDYQELVNVHESNSAWIGETGSRSDKSTPGLRNKKPTWGELYSYPKVSEWSLQDMQFDVEDWLVTDVMEDMAQTLATAIWSGNGSDKPTGMKNTAPATNDDHASPLRDEDSFEYIPLTNSSPIALTADDIIDLVYKLNPRYRANAKFSMNTVTQGFVRKLKDTNGQYLWQPSLQAGQPDMLLGYPVFTWEDMDNPTSANGFPVGFGDFRRAYLLVRRAELRIDSEGITTPGHVKFYIRRRWGGIPKNNDAVKFIKHAAS